MLILGIESSTAQVGCAIAGHEGVLASAHSTRGRRHAESLAPQIDFIRHQARIELSEISVVAVDVGPGLYTGLRVGIASAMALAHGLGVPMIGVASLDLVAWPVRYTRRLIVAVLDARRGEVFHACYRSVPGGVQRITDYRVTPPDELATDLAAVGDDCLLVGDGVLRHADVFSDLRRVEVAERGMAYPNAGSLVQLAHAQALREEFVKPWEIEPLYLRQPDAEINWTTRPS
ncbi:MAG: tRNA (adenosine(37)-N6)-threonylcarbamoyltransferase complex dimerization subunit type 1 TsaB [Acidimicrobiia bacterium]|nr:tRNA (adenosine(37)-N6)-threonylcarbamoyltransferase complex dimerization subunit type 1 TsaB [Acidimicrobiia bacterium]MDH5237479.1 tRNA (adenosine(37)-N6)-threonylcarbamoyltransferase complex dimerization subunit type 1 TsaB [Acidimicrobiia bacterium]